MKYFIISTLCISLLIFYSCDVKKSSVPAENKSKNSSVFSIKPILKRHFATIDSTVTFKNQDYRLRISQRVEKEEAIKVYLDGDTIYCNQSQIEIFFYKNNSSLLSDGFRKSKFEWLLDGPIDSVVWGHKGIDSLTDSGIYVTLILYKPLTKKYYNIQYVTDLFGTRKIWHIYDNILLENDSIFPYELNKEKVQIHSSLPVYYFYLHTHDDSVWTNYDSISILDQNKNRIQNIYFENTQIEENDKHFIKQWAPGLEFLDFNFDGYLDFRIFTNPGSRNYFYDYWSFNPKTKKYIYNPKLSNIGGLEVDTLKRQLHSYYDSGNDEYNSESYNLYQQTPILLEKEKLYGVYVNDGKKIERKYLIKENYKRIDGRLVLISKKRMTNEEFLNN